MRIRPAGRPYINVRRNPYHEFTGRKIRKEHGNCLMSEAPNVVDEKQLEELGIAIRKEV